jgi:hypothetical protein
MFESIERISREADLGQRDRSSKDFWRYLSSTLGTSPVIYSSRNQWLTASESQYLEREQEAECLPIFEGLGLNIVHTDLRFAQNLLLSKTVGVRQLDGRSLAKALLAAGLDKKVTAKELPDCLRTTGAIKKLWSEVERLLEQVGRRERSAKPEVVSELASCAIALAADKAFWPCSQVFRADKETVELFQAVLPNTPFLTAAATSIEPFFTLCADFDAKAAIEALGKLSGATLADAIRKNQIKSRELLKWFEDRKAQIVDDPNIRDSLAGLPLFPSAAGPKVLAALSLPGDFTDPLGLADVIDLAGLGTRRDFLRDLGAKDLTLENYALVHVPKALANESLSADKRRQVIRLLSDHLGRIQDDETRDALAAVAIVECTDGVFRSPSNVYFASDVVTEVLGNDAKLVLIPKQHAEAVKTFYTWLGVEKQPRLSALVKRIEQITASAPTDAAVDTSRILFGHIAGRIYDRDSQTVLAGLRTKAWLPARGNRKQWYKPGDLYADFNAYLFESQGMFLDVPQRTQQDSTELLSFLGVHVAPTEAQVVAHLLHCAEKGTTVNREVYRWLNDRHKHPAIARLDGRVCLMLDDGQYVRPQDVFWQPHPFGSFRHQLGAGLRKYNELLTALRVKESPGCSDAFSVLRDVSKAFSAGNHLLTADAKAVVLGCWQMLDRGLDEERVSADELSGLRTEKVISAPNNVLVNPEWLFFDDRPGLAAKFGDFLQNSVIQRPQGAWRAMAAAGVRPLSEAVESQLAEKTDSVADGEILRRSVERRALLARVLEFHRSGLSEQLDRLDALQCVAARELVVTYTVRAYGKDVQSLPEPAQAHLWRADNTLYFARKAGQPPWTAISRELASVLSPEEEPGRLASFIKDVLSPDDLIGAKTVLDELGIPDMEFASGDQVPESAPVSEFGVESDVPVDNGTVPSRNPTPSHPIPSRSEGDSTSASPTGAGEQPQDANVPTTVGDAIASLLGDNTSGPTSLPAELDRPDRPTSSRPDPGTGTRSTSATPGQRSNGRGEGGAPAGNGSHNGQPRSHAPRPSEERRGYAVLRSYVMPDRPETSRAADEEDQEHRTETDQAGIKRVLEAERLAQRDPQEMPPKHPGYDIESINDRFDVERYIEVKSLSGDWREADAGMTKTQFDKAAELGDRSWLYIVERATQNDFQIHRIQNPAGKANRFMFDPGWKQVAEEARNEDSTTNGKA